MSMEQIKLHPGQLMTLLRKTIAARKPVGIVGEPGTGKTEIHNQVVQSFNAEPLKDYPEGAELIVTDCALADPTDPKGLGWPDGSGAYAKFLPFGDLYRALNAKDNPKKIYVWLFDDLGWALDSVKLSYAHLIREGRINDFILPPNVVVNATSNEAGQRSGVSGWPEPVKSRFTTIVKLDVNLEATIKHFNHKGVDFRVIAHLRNRPDRLHDFKPTANLTNSPCPRTWEEASNLVNMDLPDEILLAALSGCIGAGDAIELMASIKLAKDLPDLDGIIEKPTTAPLPASDKLDVGYLIATGLAHKVTPKNFGAIAKYIVRLADNKMGEIAALCVRDCCEKENKIYTTQAFTDLMTKTDVGPLVHGLDEQ